MFDYIISAIANVTKNTVKLIKYEFHLKIIILLYTYIQGWAG